MDLTNVSCSHVAVYDSLRQGYHFTALIRVAILLYARRATYHRYTVAVRIGAPTRCQVMGVPRFHQRRQQTHQCATYGIRCGRPSGHSLEMQRPASLGLFGVDQQGLQLVRSGLIPALIYHTVRASPTHIEFADRDGNLKYFDMYGLLFAGSLTRAQRLTFAPCVPLQWDEQDIDMYQASVSSLTSRADGTTAIDVHSHAMRDRLLVLSRIGINAHCGQVSTVLSPGIALSPDHRHFVIREEYIHGRAPNKFEKRHIAPFRGVAAISRPTWSYAKAI